MNKPIHPSNTEAFYNLNVEQREWYMANNQQIDQVLGAKPLHEMEPEEFFNLKPVERSRLFAKEPQENQPILETGKVPLDKLSETIATELQAVKADAGKVDWAILPLSALEEIIKVFQFGEIKYARGNFANGEGLEYSRVLNSLMRHTTSFMRGEDNDPETGESHMAHAGCCVLMLLHYITHPEQFSANDNRAKTILK